jgi:dTMP kinase
LADHLSEQEIPFISTLEPGGSDIGKKIRRLLLSTENTEMTPRAELLLYAADRAQHVEQVVRPALAAGKVVLCDRFSDATIAYQGYARGLDLELIGKLNLLATGGIKPDLTYLIDCPVETGIGRARRRGEAEGSDEMRFEKEALSFHTKVLEGYKQIADNEPERVSVIDGTMPIDAIHKSIIELFLRKHAKTTTQLGARQD